MTIAVIGTMYYGLPDTCIVDTIINTSPATIECDEQPKHYYQYLMFYQNVPEVDTLIGYSNYLNTNQIAI